MSHVEAKVTLVDEGMSFEGTASSGHTLMLDASTEHGGQDAGFRPMELLLVGLAGCTAMDVISILRKKRQNVTGLEVRVEGKRAVDHPRVYTEICVEYVVRGQGVDPRAVERSIELSETKYCSAMAMLRAVAQITTSSQIVDE